MYFLSMFLSPIFYLKYRKGTCDINNRTNDMTSIDRICHINNISNRIKFYESPNISTLDKLQEIEENDFTTYPGFYIKKGGLVDEFTPHKENNETSRL